jgi:hypothetical protein
MVVAMMVKLVVRFVPGALVAWGVGLVELCENCVAEASKPVTRSRRPIELLINTRCSSMEYIMSD